MDEKNVLQGNTSIKMFGQDYYQNTESTETVENTETIQTVELNTTDTNTIG